MFTEPNRLGANSLLDLVVFGRSAGKNIVEKAKNSKEENLEIDNFLFDSTLEYLLELLEDKKMKEKEKQRDIEEEKNKSNTGDIRSEMQETMQKFASVYKDKGLLETGYGKLVKLLDKKITIKDKSLIWNTDLIEALELKNMLALPNVTLSASLYREESRGSHYRYDFPERDDENWMYHTMSLLDNNKVINSKTDVNFEGLYQEEMGSVPANKRVY